jgi:hypothetical protein
MEFLAAIDEEILACRVELLQAEGAAPASQQKTLEELLQEQSLDINTASNAYKAKDRNAAIPRIIARFAVIAEINPNGRVLLGQRIQKAVDDQTANLKLLRQRRSNAEKEFNRNIHKSDYLRLKNNVSICDKRVQEAKALLEKQSNMLKFFQKLKSPDIKAPPSK